MGTGVASFLGMNPVLVGSLVTTLRTQATKAEDSAARVQSALALAGLDSSLPARLTGRAEGWRDAAGVLSARVDEVLEFQLLLDIGINLPPEAAEELTAGLPGVSSVSELNQMIEEWAGSDNDPMFDELVAERERLVAAFVGDDATWDYDPDTVAFAQSNNLSYGEAELIVRTWALDEVQGQIDAYSGGSVYDPALNALYEARSELLLEVADGDETLAAAIGRLMSNGVPAIDAVFAAPAEAFADWSIAEVDAALAERAAVVQDGGFDPFLFGIAALHAQKVEQFTGADSLDVHPGVAAMAEAQGVSYNEVVAWFNADLAANPDAWPVGSAPLPFLAGPISTSGEALMFLSDEDVFRELETSTQDVDDYDGQLSVDDLQHVVDNPEDFSDRAVAVAEFLLANEVVRAEFDTARNGDFLLTLGDGEVNIGDTDGVISYADVLAAGTNRWVFDTLAGSVTEIDSNGDRALTPSEFEAFLDQTDDENLRAALEFAIDSGLDDDDRGVFETLVDGGWEISSLMPGSPAFMFEAVTDPRGLAENYGSFGLGAGTAVVGMGQFVYDASATNPGSPFFWIESVRVGGDTERHRGVRLVTSMPALVEAGLSLVPNTPWASEQAENVRRMGTTDAHSGLNLIGAVIDFETFQRDPSRWAGQLAPDVLITVLTGGGGAAARAASTARRLLTSSRAALTRLRNLPRLNPRLVARSAGDGSKWLDEAGNVRWPPNRGFAHDPVEEVLSVGARLDRYGRPSGRFVSPEGTPYSARSLAPGTDPDSYRVYEVIKPIDGVAAGKASPWFDEVGLGTQYELPNSVQWLLDNGYLREVS